jgi:pimeloyl-ACP methyl ester carboxylesterase
MAEAPDFTVVAWDEPGAGGSSYVSARFGLDDYATCLAALIEALALGPAHVAPWAGTVARARGADLPRHACGDGLAGSFIRGREPVWTLE